MNTNYNNQQHHNDETYQSRYVSNGVTQIEKNVMATVRVVHTLRALSSKTALELYAFGASLIGLVVMVSLPHVASNLSLVASHGFSNVGVFLVVAVIKTNLLVQVALLLGAFSFVALAKDLARSFSRQSAFAA